MAGNDQDVPPSTANAGSAGAFALAAAQAVGGMRVQARDQLVSRAAHDLRSPLNGIQGWTHVLSSRLGQEGGIVAKALDGIRSGVQQQVQQIGDLTDLLQVMAAGLALELAQTDAHAVLSRATAESQPTAQTRSVTLSLDADAVATELYADAGRLTQALRYIIVHCVRCAMEGDVIALGVERTATDTVFHVGTVGHRPDDAADQVVTKTPSALLLAERLVDLHGGQLRAFALDADGIRQGYRVSFPAAAAARLMADPAAYQHLASARAQMPREALRVAVRTADAVPEGVLALLHGIGCVAVTVSPDAVNIDADVELVPVGRGDPLWPGQGRLAYADTDAASSAGGVLHADVDPLQAAGLLLAARRSCAV